MAIAITESVWRNDKPVAPDLYIDAYRGQPIDISLKEFLVQGARDLVPLEGSVEEVQEQYLKRLDFQNDIITEKGARRGWACSYFNISRPGYGRLENSIYADGFRYTSVPNYIGEDCFSYVMNNGFQSSLPGRVTVNVRNYMEGRILIEEDTTRRSSNRRAFRYVAQWYIPPEFGTFSHVVMTWYEHSPVRSMADGKVVVRTQKKKVASSVLTYDPTKSTGFQFVERNHAYPANQSFISTSWPNTAFNGALNAETGATYNQPEGPWPVSVEISFRRQKITSTRKAIYRNNSRFPVYETRYVAEWEHEESIEIDVRTQYGANWWRNGLIQDIHAPGFVPNVPKAFVPDIPDDE